MKYFFVTVSLLFLTLAAAADPILPCGSTASELVAQWNCRAGRFILSNFSYRSTAVVIGVGTASAIDPHDYHVNISADPTHLTFEINAPFFISSGGPIDDGPIYVTGSTGQTTSLSFQLNTLPGLQMVGGAWNPKPLPYWDDPNIPGIGWNIDALGMWAAGFDASGPFYGPDTGAATFPSTAYLPVSTTVNFHSLALGRVELNGYGFRIDAAQAPVPEPSSFVLFILATPNVLAAFSRYRRKKLDAALPS